MGSEMCIRDSHKHDNGTSRNIAARTTSVNVGRDQRPFRPSLLRRRKSMRRLVGGSNSSGGSVSAAGGRRRRTHATGGRRRAGRPPPDLSPIATSVRPSVCQTSFAKRHCYEQFYRTERRAVRSVVAICCRRPVLTRSGIRHQPTHTSSMLNTSSKYSLTGRSTVICRPGLALHCRRADHSAVDNRVLYVVQ